MKWKLSWPPAGGLKWPFRTAARLKEPGERWYRRSERGVRGPLLAFLPFWTVLGCQLVMLQDLGKSWSWLMEHPWATVVTYLAVLLTELAVERLSTSLLFSGAVTLLPCFLLAVASHLKEEVNGVPLLLSDLSMIGQAAEITGFLSPEMGIGSGTQLAILCSVVLLALAFLWDRPLHRSIWWKRMFTAVGMVLLLSILLTLSVTGELLDDREKGEDQASRNQRLGVLAGMYAAARQNSAVEPDEYTEDNMNRIALRISADAPRVKAPEVKPNVVLLVSESFYDPTRLPNVTYSSDPIPNYHALAEEFPAGSFLTCAYGGGTGYAEMEILTGIPSIFPEGGETLTTMAGAGVYERVPSLAKAFSAQGYHTAYIHSHTNALYNRTEHMPALGFETIRFSTDFTVDTYTEGYYMSDDSWADQLIAEFEAKEEGQPIFLYGLNMENHQPYNAGKFEDKSPIEISTDRLEGEKLEMFDALIHGLYQADAALKKLVDYFEQVEEPTILVFLGDHLSLPNFGEGDTLYVRLGYSSSSNTMTWDADELKRMLSTNFLVWNNYGADFPVGEELSATFIGSQLLSWAGLPKPLYYCWLDTAAKDMLYYRDRLFVAADGTASHKVTPSCEATVRRFRTIVYDFLYGKNYATEALTGAAVRKVTTQYMPEVVAPPDEEDDLLSGDLLFLQGEEGFSETLSSPAPSGDTG